MEKNLNSLRQDLFFDKKCLHIKMDKEVHLALRSYCLQRGTSMQSVLSEFANLVASGDKRAQSIIDSYVLKKVKEPKKRMKRKNLPILSEPDKESLYDLIDSEEFNESESTTT